MSRVETVMDPMLHWQILQKAILKNVRFMMGTTNLHEPPRTTVVRLDSSHGARLRPHRRLFNLIIDLKAP
eukprot:scaffold4399_cov267-Chaetoceros_neogracile.AAC.21